MIEHEGVRPEGCICEISSDIQRYLPFIRIGIGLN